MPAQADGPRTGIFLLTTCWRELDLPICHDRHRVRRRVSVPHSPLGFQERTLTTKIKQFHTGGNSFRGSTGGKKLLKACCQSTPLTRARGKGTGADIETLGPLTYTPWPLKPGLTLMQTRVWYSVAALSHWKTYSKTNSLCYELSRLSTSFAVIVHSVSPVSEGETTVSTALVSGWQVWGHVHT